jgi:hypothetical protein
MLFANGVIADYPTQLKVRNLPGAGGLHALGTPRPTGSDPLLETVAGHPGFSLLADLEFTGRVDAPGLAALAAPGSTDEVRISVPLGADEGAVVLSECDGLLRWELPSIEEGAPAALGAAAAPRRLGVFRAHYQPIAAASEGLGLDVRTILKPLRKLVLRFAARKAAEGISEYLERGLRQGPTVLARDPSGGWAWRDLDDFAGLTLGEGPRRVLLFVHGTFSSSRGSFGGLCTPANAAAFLDRVGTGYDAIIGFDHPTLRASVPENAETLAKALATLPGDEIRIDAIAFSRGGLLLRWLTEARQPPLPEHLHLERAVFVGCTNNGTLLADPPHWRTLVNLYTNLVAAAARLAVLVGGPVAAAPAATIGGAIRGLLSFVQLLASEAIDGEAVPGLASMAPDGEVVARLNGPAAAAPPHPADYYVCEADFDHSLFGGPGPVDRGLPQRLLLEFADTLVDQLFRRDSNDLVVNRDSMSHFAPWLPPERIAGGHQFGKDDGIYHTVYFDDPRVAAQLTDWLG